MTKEIAVDKPKAKSLELVDDEIKTLVTGLDSSVKLMCGQLTQAPNSLDVLAQVIPRLVDIQNQYQKLDKLFNTKQENTDG